MPLFDYGRAFSRNIGWLSKDEQHCLRAKRIAIAGLGGVGGSHLLSLTRLGIGHFRIADFDHFEVHNFNRQAGARVSTLGLSKCAVMADMARDINPELDIDTFESGITAENIDAFLAGVDVYVDALDFFALDAREMVFRRCQALGIPALTAAPLGMGTAFLAFTPDGMSFSDYFDWAGRSETDKLVRFIAGLSPAMLQRPYLVVPEAVNFAQRTGPSVGMACDLCAGLMGSQVLKLLLGRGKVSAAPRGLHFDAYREKLVHTWRPGGNRNPLQKLLMWLIRKKLNL